MQRIVLTESYVAPQVKNHKIALDSKNKNDVSHFFCTMALTYVPVEPLVHMPETLCGVLSHIAHHWHLLQHIITVKFLIANRTIQCINLKMQATHAMAVRHMLILPALLNTAINDAK